MIPSGCKVPPVISRLPALVILLSALLMLLACGQTATPMPTPTMGLEPVATPTPTPTPTMGLEPVATPTPTPTPTAGLEPVATEVVTPPASKATVAERDGDDEVKDAVQQLFDNWNRALRERDAALFHSFLTRQLAGSCGLEGLQSWLDQGEEFLAEAEVRSVFLDVADPSRAFAEITARQHAGGPEVPLSFPWPVALEEGEWRAGFPAGWTAESCPRRSEASELGYSD